MTEVDVSGPAIRELPRATIRTFVNRCLWLMHRLGHSSRTVSEVSIAFVDDAAMKRLNRSWRGKNKTTDVLTFPSGDETSGALGDIVISVDQARRQARSERHSLATEIRYLLLHGLIHAHGYDHETDDGEMHGVEMDLRARVGLD